MGELEFRLVYLCGSSGAVTIEKCTTGEIECPRCKAKMLFSSDKLLTDLSEAKGYHQLRRVVELGNSGEQREGGNASK